MKHDLPEENKAKITNAVEKCKNLNLLPIHPGGFFEIMIESKIDCAYATISNLHHDMIDIDVRSVSIEKILRIINIINEK